MLGELPVPGRPTSLEKSRAKGLLCLQLVRAGPFGHFSLSSINSLFFLPLSGRRSDID